MSLTTAAQPNITSVGTLDSLIINSVFAKGLVVQNDSSVSTASLNIVSSYQMEQGIRASGNAITPNCYFWRFANVDRLLMDINGNLAINQASINTLYKVEVNGAIKATSIAGTLQTAAQPNITSLGTLSNLTLDTSGTGLYTPTLTCDTISKTGTLNINPTILQIKGTTLNATAAELNKLAGCTASTVELNYIDLTTGPGTAEASKALVLDSISSITTGISSLTSTNPISTSATQCQIAAGTSFTSTTRASDFNLIIRNQSNSVGAQAGLSFTIEGTSDLTTYTPSVNLYCTRTANPTTQYAMADFAISTRSGANALSPMTERMRITQQGYIRFGSATSTAKIDITLSASLLSGSWQRAMRIANDATTQIEFEIQVYNDLAGGSNGVALGTTTIDPLRFMVGNSTRAYINNSGRLGVDLGPSWSPEATIHSGGEVWANNYYHCKGSSDGFARYRFNWPQTDYPAIGTDSTIGAIRIGKCDANYNWTAYVPVRGGAYTNASDVRLKADIVDCPFGLDTVMRVRPRRFRMVQEQTEVRRVNA